MNELNLEALTSSPMMLLGVLLTMVIKALRSIPGYPSWGTPMVSMVLGSVLYSVLSGFTVNNAFLGLIIGGFSVGLHQSVKQWEERKDPKLIPSTKGNTTLYSMKDKQGAASTETEASSDGASKISKAVKGVGGGIVVVALSLGLLGSTGCATVGSPSKTTVAKTSAVIQTSAQLGVYYAVKNSPETRKYFESASLALDILLKEGVYDPEELTARLGHIEIDELHSEDIQVAVLAAVNLYTAYFSDQVAGAVDKERLIRPVLEALKLGLDYGLNLKKTEKAYGIVE